MFLVIDGYIKITNTGKLLRMTRDKNVFLSQKLNSFNMKGQISRFEFIKTD